MVWCCMSFAGGEQASQGRGGGGCGKEEVKGGWG